MCVYVSDAELWKESKASAVDCGWHDQLTRKSH